MDEIAVDEMKKLEKKLKNFFHENEVHPFLAASVMLKMFADVAAIGDVKNNDFIDTCKRQFLRAKQNIEKAKKEIN